jgi:FkbM family methyltransferase
VGVTTIGARGASDRPSRTLPNGWDVEEMSRSETDYLYREIVEQAVYFLPGLHLHDGTVVDVGANIGLFSLYAYQNWPVERLIAVEAIPDVRDVLRRNVRHISGVVVPDFAAGAVEEECLFAYYPKYSMMSGRYADPVEDFALVRQYAQKALGPNADADVITHLDDLLGPRFEPEFRRVCTLPLATICQQAGVRSIDLLKIDVEGDELSVLDGLGDVTVRNAVVEVDRRRSSPDAVRSALETKRLNVSAVAAAGYENSPLSYLVARER